MEVDKRRTRSLNHNATGPGSVVYWMERDQRATENWALLHAKERAVARKVPLLVVYNLLPGHTHVSNRQRPFLLKGLEEVAERLARSNISFYLLHGEPDETLPDFIATHSAGELVVDFSPLRAPRKWRQRVSSHLSVTMTEVDAHNIVPCWQASQKVEFGARTFRPRVQRQLKTYCTDFPPLRKHPYTTIQPAPTIAWQEPQHAAEVNSIHPPVTWLVPGTQHAKQQTTHFITQKLTRYAEDRNNPTVDALSHLSPYLHFGHLSAQWVARQVQTTTGVPALAKESFLDELIVRRELSDNFCYYNPHYDKVSGAHAWAQKTIAAHASDPRPYHYTCQQFAQSKTHDELWNAMQYQLVYTGKLHGWCRMYWAKKILEWTPDTHTAIRIALHLNDTYELDGKDPNGVVGVMWAICGVHDRAWTERPIFGKIRYMNAAGAKRKFDVATYIAHHSRK